MNKLLIVGNGFDLQAQLKSRFRDFFEEKEIPLLTEWINDGKANLVKDISLLTLLLYNCYYRKDTSYRDWSTPGSYYTVQYNSTYKKVFGIDDSIENWMDVESFLSNILKSKNLKLIIDCFNNHFKSKDGYKDYICEYDNVTSLVECSLNAKQYSSIDDFYSFFLEEIHLFERRFINYLQEQLNGNIVYDVNSRDILISLLCPVKGDTVKIVNFNYTSLPQLEDIYLNGISQTNVHGTLLDNPIIGIDSSNCNNDHLIPFTKTFRKLFNGNYKQVLSGQFDEIIIYGHSLGDQDYSYFQSIFDYVDLYSAQTTIEFVYSDNFLTNQKDKNILRIEKAKSLYKLIDTYGLTLDNKDNGKNLLHKLILEGRIKINAYNYINPN